jgi:hypothetical protein
MAAFPQNGDHKLDSQDMITVSQDMLTYSQNILTYPQYVNVIVP